MAGRPRVTLGFAGAGWIAGVHGYAVGEVPGLAVTKVASRRAERAAEAAARMGAAAVPLDAVSDGVDGVVICTPPALHHAHARAALDAGAGTLVEKPLTVTLAEADDLVAAEEAGATIAYAENLLHAPAVGLAVEHAAQLDGIDLLEVRALQARPDWGDFLSEAWGGGVLFDLGVHPLALVLALAAPARPVEVKAVLAGAPDHPVDEHADVRIAFDSGLVARVEVSWRQEGQPVWDVQVSAPDGVVRLDLLPEVRLERNGVEVALPPVPEGVVPQLEQLGYLPQMESFALDLLEHRRPRWGAAFARQVLDVVCGAYLSAGRSSGWVELPFPGPRHRSPISLWREP